ncbi:hypothetical protein BBJ28_00006490 [Nothophytophthora sp. Chile5]|nr:hypothetical protein BBJ28_00006490 [Nothophytophthora sp. Chile5]
MRSVFRPIRATVAFAAGLLLVSGPTVVQAKACTSAQLVQLNSVANTYTNSPDCAGSALDSAANTVAEICAGACMQLLRDLAPDTPDCEYDGTNLGETVNGLVAMCAFESDSGSSSGVNLGSESGFNSGSDSATVSDTVEECTTAEMLTMSDLNDEAATSADCQGSAGISAGSSIGAFCDESACVAYMSDVESQLPNCTYAGYNLKQVIADTLAVCDDPTKTLPPTATSSSTPATTTTPKTTTPTPTKASSLVTDTPAVTVSPASSLKPGATVVTAASLLLAAVLAFTGL